MISQGTNPYFHKGVGELFKTRFIDVKFIGNNATLLGPAIRAYFDIFKVLNITTKEKLAKFSNNSLILDKNNQNRTWSLDEVSLEKPEIFRIKFYDLFTTTEVDTLTNLKEVVENPAKATLHKEIFTRMVDRDIELQVKSGQSLP